MDNPNARPGTGRDDRATSVDETDLAADRMGNNQLQGNDQTRVHNERQAAPDVRQEADADPVESFEKMDKDHRAETELGKGNRSGGEGGR
jgi:hypothetical protein